MLGVISYALVFHNHFRDVLRVGKISTICAAIASQQDIKYHGTLIFAQSNIFWVIFVLPSVCSWCLFLRQSSPRQERGIESDEYSGSSGNPTQALILLKKWKLIRGLDSWSDFKLYLILVKYLNVWPFSIKIGCVSFFPDSSAHSLDCLSDSDPHRVSTVSVTHQPAKAFAPTAPRPICAGLF